jgi:hypothetical protein
MAVSELQETNISDTGTGNGYGTANNAESNRKLKN